MYDLYVYLQIDPDDMHIYYSINIYNINQNFKKFSNLTYSLLFNWSRRQPHSQGPLEGGREDSGNSWISKTKSTVIFFSSKSVTELKRVFHLKL